LCFNIGKKIGKSRGVLLYSTFNQLDLERQKDRQNMSIPDIDIASMEPMLPEEANRDLEDIL